MVKGEHKRFGLDVAPSSHNRGALGGVASRPQRLFVPTLDGLLLPLVDEDARGAPAEDGLLVHELVHARALRVLQPLALLAQYQVE